MSRGNLMLGWLACNYPEARLAVVIRDPVEVARSQQLGGWPLEFESFMSQLNMVEDYPVLESGLVAGAEGQFKLNVLHWAIENRMTLDQLETARSGGAKAEAFSYHARRDDRWRFREFLAFCGAPATDAAMRHLHRPSRVSRLVRAETGPSAPERAFTVRVAEAFGLSDYLAPGTMGNMQLAGALSTRNCACA